MLAWRKSGKLWDRYVHDISNVNDKISNSKEEKNFDYNVNRRTRWRNHREPRGHSSAASSSSTSQWQNKQWHTSWSSCNYVSDSWKEFQKIDWSVDKTPTHNTHLCNTVCSQARTNCIDIFVCLKRVLSSGVFHVSSLVVVSPAFHHEHFIFLIHSSSQDTRTRNTIGTTRATPITPSTSRTSPSSHNRQAAPSRITLTWTPAE